MPRLCVVSHVAPFRSYEIDYTAKINCGTYNCTYSCADAQCGMGTMRNRWLDRGRGHRHSHAKARGKKQTSILRLGKSSSTRVTQKDLFNEIRNSALSKMFSHPNIVRTLDYGTVVSDGRGCAYVSNGTREAIEQQARWGLRNPDDLRLCKSVYSVLEFCNMGDLEHLTRRNWEKGVRLGICQGISGTMLQLALGLHYIHQKGYVHLDMKTENALVHRTGETVGGQGGNLHAKIIDFGFMRRVSNVVRSGRVPTCGTREMKAPEQMRDKSRVVFERPYVGRDGSVSTNRREFRQAYVLSESNVKKIDVYSLGCMYFEMLCFGADVMKQGWTSDEPKMNIAPLREAMMSETHPIPKRKRIPLAQLILRMLSPIVRERPLTEDVIRLLRIIDAVPRGKQTTRKSRGSSRRQIHRYSKRRISHRPSQR